MMAIQVRAFIIGRYPIRGFLAWGAGESAAVFIDPGGWDEMIDATVRQFSLTVSAVLLTHGHWDHIEGVREMTARFHAPVFAHVDDARLLEQSPDVILQGDETITCGSLNWQVLHLPGHTSGSVAYTAGDVVFTGDTLFAGAIGGTSTLAEYERERAGIHRMLFALGDATRVYPAHGPATSIGIERRCNPFLR